MNESTLLTVFAALLVCAVVGYLIIGQPIIAPWSEEQYGKAELARAEQNRQVAVAEANAKFESAKLLAQAEVERSKGVAQSNQIIGDSLKDNEAYLRYLYIQALSEHTNQIIYVPTEGTLPILEAGRLEEHAQGGE